MKKLDESCMLILLCVAACDLSFLCLIKYMLFLLSRLKVYSFIKILFFTNITFSKFSWEKYASCRTLRITVYRAIHKCTRGTSKGIRIFFVEELRQKI